jgi:hypothetical protein
MATTPRQRIVAILRSHTAKRIRFIAPTTRGGDITIDHTTFETVAKAIDDVRIRITVQAPAAFPAGIAAQYDSTNIQVPFVTVPGLTSGELRTSPVIGRDDEGFVIHDRLQIEIGERAFERAASSALDRNRAVWCGESR